MTSPQEQPTPQKPSYPLDVAMASQQRAFAATVPNMIPHLAAIPKENNSNCMPFPNLEVKHQVLYPKTSPVFSHSANNPHMRSDPHIDISPHRSGFALSLAVHSDTSEHSAGMKAVNQASYMSNTQAINLPALSGQLQGVPSMQTVQAASILLKPAGKTVNRVPSNDVPRKAPLQGNSHAGKLLPQDISHKFPKPREQRPTSQQESPTLAKASVQKRRQSTNDERQSTPIQSSFLQPEKIRAKKRTRNHHDDGSQEVEISKVTEVKGDEKENKSNTTETTTSDKTHGQEVKPCAVRPRRRPTKKRVAEAACPTPPGYLEGRRPLYEYQVPLEVEGISQALGQRNWNEYLYLLESLWLDKLTAHEFEQRTKPLFHIEYAGIRKKMNSLVVTKMILPRLEEVRSRLHQRPQ